MQYLELKNKAKKQGLRITKTVKGKRVKLTARELRTKIRMNFDNSVKNAQRVIRVCQTIVAPTVVRAGIPPTTTTSSTTPTTSTSRKCSTRETDG